MGPAIRIALNGRCLYEVKTLRENDDDAGADREGDAYVSFDMEHFRAGIDGQATMLVLPLMTALQLYADGVLFSRSHTPIRLSLGERTTRPLYIEWMRHVAKSPRHAERVLVRLVPTPPPASPPPQESA